MGLSKRDHFDPAKSPKRILALDGGGIRGILTLEFLKIIETLVKQRLGEGALLCDYLTSLEALRPDQSSRLAWPAA